MLTLSSDNLGIIQWYVDASYATHEDCKGHTRAMMTMGEGVAISLSQKRKSNSQSSTEAGLIGVYVSLLSVLHVQYFLEAQGYDIKETQST